MLNARHIIWNVQPITRNVQQMPTPNSVVSYAALRRGVDKFGLAMDQHLQRISTRNVYVLCSRTYGMCIILCGMCSILHWMCSIWYVMCIILHGTCNIFYGMASIFCDMCTTLHWICSILSGVCRILYGMCCMLCWMPGILYGMCLFARCSSVHPGWCWGYMQWTYSWMGDGCSDYLNAVPPCFLYGSWLLMRMLFWLSEFCSPSVSSTALVFSSDGCSDSPN